MGTVSWNSTAINSQLLLTVSSAIFTILAIQTSPIFTEMIRSVRALPLLTSRNHHCVGSIKFLNNYGDQIGDIVNSNRDFLRGVRGVDMVRVEGNCCFMIGQKYEMKGRTLYLTSPTRYEYNVPFSTAKSVHKIDCKTKMKLRSNFTSDNTVIPIRIE